MWWLDTFILSLIASSITCATSITTVENNESTKLLPVFTYFKHQPINFTDITYQIHNGLKSLNISDIEVNIIFNTAENNQNITDEIWVFENSLKYLFKNALKANWDMKDLLKDIAIAVDNVTVSEVLYEILWEELKQNDKKNNPFSYIELYTDIEKTLTSYNTTSIKLNHILSNIEKDLVECSANILQSYFIHNSTVSRLLDELKNVSNVYHITIPIVFDKLKTIENRWLISEALLQFDTKTSDAVYNHISYIEYLNSLNEIIPNKIYHNLESLIARTDFINISVTERKISSKLLPLSMATLFTVEKICLKNITTNFYLYECPETYLMCTNLIANSKNQFNRKRAAYEVERVGQNAYTLYNRYWSRYLRLQSNNSKDILLPSNNTNISKITKNIYSHAESSSWFISFHGDYATLQDSKEKSFVCGGDSTYWSNSENYAYTRKINDIAGKENECLWLLEDCTNVD